MGQIIYLLNQEENVFVNEWKIVFKWARKNWSIRIFSKSDNLFFI